jgi:hypothetical protein
MLSTQTGLPSAPKIGTAMIQRSDGLTRSRCTGSLILEQRDRHDDRKHDVDVDVIDEQAITKAGEVAGREVIPTRNDGTPANRARVLKRLGLVD